MMWPFKRKPHVHAGYKWDNYYEWCSGGSSTVTLHELDPD